MVASRLRPKKVFGFYQAPPGHAKGSALAIKQSGAGETRQSLL